MSNVHALVVQGLFQQRRGAAGGGETAEERGGGHRRGTVSEWQLRQRGVGCTHDWHEAHVQIARVRALGTCNKASVAP